MTNSHFYSSCFGIVLALCICLCSSLLGVTVEQYNEDDLEIVMIESDQLALRIAANSGGRILSLIDKSDGVECVWWGSATDGRSGLLDDKGDYTGMPYSISIEDAGPQAASVRLDATGGELALSKRITVVQGEPAIRVEYVYENSSDAVVNTTHMVRNYYIAGGEAGPEDHYFWMGPRGVEEWEYPYEGRGAYYAEVERPWHAMIDTEALSGMVWIIDSPVLGRFYNWTDGAPQNPTVEWEVVLDLEPGESVTVPVTMGLLRGLECVTDATDQAVLYLEPTSMGTSLTIDGKLYALSQLQDNGQVDLRFDYETLDRIFIWGEIGIHFAACQPGQAVSGQTTFNAPSLGTYVVMLNARNGSLSLTEFEFPVIVGESNGSYFRGRREDEPTRPLVVVTDKDVDCGYVLHWGGAGGPFPQAQSLELTMGTDEYESLELDILALRDVGLVSAQVVTDSIPEDVCHLQVQDGVSNSGADMELSQYALVSGNSHTMEAGAHKAFWLTLASHSLSPGDYSFEIEISPENAPSRSIHVLLHVLDVQRAPWSEASLHMYHLFSYISSHFDQHAELMTSHYIRQIQVCLCTNVWRNAVRVSRDGDGVLDVDFSDMDLKLQRILDAGFTELALLSGCYYHESWFDLLNGESDEIQQEARTEFRTRLIQHFFDRGFEEVWTYAIDEPSVNYATSPEIIAIFENARASHPDLKMHMTVLHYSPLLINTLNQYMDRFTPCWAVTQTLLEDIENDSAVIDAGDRIGYYCGEFLNRSPDKARADGWKAAFHDIPYYSIFAYHFRTGAHPSWGLYGDGPDGPVTTGPFEALRDGYEDYAYWRRFGMLLGEVSSLDSNLLSEQDQEIVANAMEFRSRVFTTEDEALIPMELKPGNHGGRAWADFSEPDRWRFLRVKGELLERIVELQSILCD